MKLWLDAHFSPSVATWLRRHHGIDAESLRDLGLRDAEDADIFEAARVANAWVMTKDKDFPEMVCRCGAPPQILWVTCGNTSTRALCEILEVAIPTARRLLEAGEPLVEITDSRNP